MQLHCVHEKNLLDTTLWNFKFTHAAVELLQKEHFPPHLNNVSTLPCDTCNAHRSRATLELLQKEAPEFITSQLWPPNSPDLNSVDNSMWEMLQREGVQNTHHRSGAISDATNEWLPQWRHSPALDLIAPLCSQSLFQFVQVSDTCFVHLLQ